MDAVTANFCHYVRFATTFTGASSMAFHLNGIPHWDRDSEARRGPTRVMKEFFPHAGRVESVRGRRNVIFDSLQYRCRSPKVCIYGLYESGDEAETAMGSNLYP
jgi:hypothetical protein